MKHFTCIEPLEARIAPATIISPYEVTYLDGSGQTAVVKISNPLFTSPAAAAKILVFDNGGFTGNSTQQNLTEIDLLGRADAQGMDIGVTVVPQVTGPNTVNVGYIAAANFSTFGEVTQNIYLGNINIQGDLGGITVGGSNSTPPALNSLKVLSMNEGEQSDVLGTINSLHDAGDFGANMQFLGYQFGSIGNLYIGGALNGNPSGGTAANVSAGEIQFDGHIGAATIGSIAGSSTQFSGSLMGSPLHPSYIGTLHVLGSVTGGSGLNTGEISTTSSIGTLTIGGSLVGGRAGNGSSNGDSGFIQTSVLNSLSIAGSLTGGNQGMVANTPVHNMDGSTTQTYSPDPNQTASFSGAVSVGTAHVVSIGSIQGGSGASSGLLQATGSLGKVTIAGNVVGGSAGTGQDNTGTAGDSGAIIGASATNISIGGMLIGGSEGTTPVTTTPSGSSPVTVNSPDSSHTGNTSGIVRVNTAPSISIGGIQGGGGFSSGVLASNLFASASYGTVTIQGDVAGGSGTGSGSIRVGQFSGAGTVQTLHVTGNLTGGSGAMSGEISTASALASLSIGHNITGGTVDSTGAILVGGKLGMAAIGGNLAASSAINSSSPVTESGYIEAGSIGSMHITGNVASFANAGSGGIASSGAIRSDTNLASLTIDGTVTGVSANPVVISAAEGPRSSAKPGTDLAIHSVSIGGNVSYLDLLAGYSAVTSTTSNNVTNPIGAPLGTPVDGTAQIGTVSLAGTLAASNIVAGVKLGTASSFGAAGNAPISGPDNVPGLHSIIASIIVDGTATGNGAMNGTFGFVSQELMSVKVDQVQIPLKPGPENDTTPVHIAGNLYALEAGAT